MDNTCIVDCTDMPACWYATIDCPEGFACEVDCEPNAGANGCRNAIVNCPDTYACDVVCDGSAGCQDMTLNCSDGSCGVDCAFWNACDGMEILCGEGQCVATCSYVSDYGNLPNLISGDACDSSVFTTAECAP